jgi:hypothetical protein
MVKKTYPTGLMYLCQTSLKDPYSYKGSGKRWLNHLRLHRPHIVTWVVCKCETLEDLRAAGLFYSKLWNVVESDDWANLREEDGMGGGSGKVGRTWKVKDTSRMKGNGDRSTNAARAGYDRVASKMAGDNNPSRRFAFTEKQIESAKRFQRLRTEKSMKAIRVIFSDGHQEDFESKRQVCYKFGITYDILNYRLRKNLDLNGTRFEEITK